jgi:hypothetical protein
MPRCAEGHTDTSAEGHECPCAEGHMQPAEGRVGVPQDTPASANGHERERSELGLTPRRRGPGVCEPHKGKGIRLSPSSSLNRGFQILNYQRS